MQPEDQVRVKHMVEAAADAAQFISGRVRADLDTDRMLLFALIRCIEIIGEAARQITEETRNLSEDIPWNAIAGMRKSCQIFPCSRTTQTLIPCGFQTIHPFISPT